MKGKFPLALSVAVLCFFSVWICGLDTVAPYAPTYAVFLFWASWYCAGSGVPALKSSLLCNICGSLWGFIGVMFLTPLFGFAGGLALPIAIFFVGGFMVLQSYWPPLGFVPGCFIGCATFFAVANSALIGPKGMGAVLLACVISAVVGNLLGIGSVMLADLLTKKE